MAKKLFELIVGEPPSELIELPVKPKSWDGRRLSVENARDGMRGIIVETIQALVAEKSPIGVGVIVNEITTPQQFLPHEVEWISSLDRERLALQVERIMEKRR